MNLEEVLDPKFGLQQDEWPGLGFRFGKENQLSVIGWSGKYNYEKLYIVSCEFCKTDTELFGEGLFKTKKQNILKGILPCGCSISPLSESQYRVLCTRKSLELGYKFIGFTGEWLGCRTVVKLCCKLHGEWVGGSIDNLLRGRGCPHCKASKLNRKSDTEMVQKFFNSGAFHPETKFSRVEKSVQGRFKTVWLIHCPVCDMRVESIGASLQRGHTPCGCSPQSPTEAYIQVVSTDGLPIALKFGVSKRSKYRVKEARSKTAMDVEIFAVYKFNSMNSCRSAERECKQQFDCGILSKVEFSDGYTETTWVYNLDKIIEIYERNGGIKIE